MFDRLLPVVVEVRLEQVRREIDAVNGHREALSAGVRRHRRLVAAALLSTTRPASPTRRGQRIWLLYVLVYLHVLLDNDFELFTDDDMDTCATVSGLRASRVDSAAATATMLRWANDTAVCAAVHAAITAPARRQDTRLRR